MKQTIYKDDFVRAFKNYGREDQFSRDGLVALFDYLEEYEDSTGEQVELDVIALCCDYTERGLKETLDDYNLESLEELQNHTQVIVLDDETIIYQNY